MYDDSPDELSPEQIKANIRFLKRKLMACRKKNDRSPEGYILMMLGNYYSLRGDYKEAVEVLKQSVTARQEAGDLHAEGYTLRMLGGAYIGLREYRDAIQSFENSLSITEKIGITDEIALAFRGLAIIYENCGRKDIAAKYLERAAKIYRKASKLEDKLIVLEILGSLYEKLREPQKALQSYRKSLIAYEKLGDKKKLARIHFTIGVFYINRGKLDLATQSFELSRKIFKELGDTQHEGYALMNMGFAFAEQHKWSQAESSWYEAFRKLPPTSSEFERLSVLFRRVNKTKQNKETQDAQTVDKINDLADFVTTHKHPLNHTVRFIMNNFKDKEIRNLFVKYRGEKRGFGRISSEKLLTFLEYCQSHYLLIDLLRYLYEIRPNEFVEHFGTDISPEIYRYGDVERIKPISGGVLLENNSLSRASAFLQGEQGKTNEQFHNLACLMQLVDAIVAHERIYVVDLPISDALKSVSELFYIVPMSFDIEQDILDYRSRQLSIPRASLKVVKAFYMPYFGETLDTEDNENHKRQVDDEMQPIHKFSRAEKHATVFISPADEEYSILTAAKIGLPFRPDPYHSSSTREILAKIKSTYYSSFLDQTLQTVQSRATSESEKMNQWLSEARYKIETPLIFNYVIDKAVQKGEGIIDIALQVRESSEAKAFRRFCTEFDIAARHGADKELYKLKVEIDRACDRLNLQFQQPTIQTDIQFPLSVSLSVSSLWEVIQYKRKRHLVFIDELYRSALKSRGKDYTLLQIRKLQNR